MNKSLCNIFTLLLILSYSLNGVLIFGQFANPNEESKVSLIKSKIHATNIGKIVFIDSRKDVMLCQESDFLDSIDITLNKLNSINLFIRGFHTAPLTSFLKKLAPNNDTIDLLEYGNYQFTFYVNNKKIYTEQLHKGAGSLISKSESSSFYVPLYSSTNEDSWGRFLWMRFMYRGGGIHALNLGHHILKIEIRPYLEQNKLIVGNIISEGQINLNININDEEIDPKVLKIQQIKKSNDWKIAEKTLTNDPIKKMNKKIASNVFQKITSIVVIKDGKIALEEYFNGTDRTTLHDTRSVSKSIVGTLLGMAISDGYIKDEYQTIDNFYDLEQYKNPSISKSKITLKDLLTMSSAFNGSDINESSPGNENKMYPTADWVKFVLDLSSKKRNKENQQWDYFTGGTVLIGDILDKSIPEGLEKYAKKQFFDKLQITNYKWQYTPNQVVNTAGGLAMTTLDLAKYGQLYKDNGMYKNEELVSSKWIKRSMTKHQKIQYMAKSHYGYLFWNLSIKINDKIEEVYYASGNGGNKIYIFKNLPLVCVITCTAYNTPFADIQAKQILEQHILPSIYH